MMIYGLTTIDRVLQIAGLEIPVKSTIHSTIPAAVVHLTESEISLSSPSTRMKLIPDFETIKPQTWGRHVIISNRFLKNLKDGKYPSVFSILYSNRINPSLILDCGNRTIAQKVYHEIQNLSL